MKRLLLIIILTLSFQSLTKADDIRDFEIEGMSIGDSLLDLFSIDEIKKAEENPSYYPDKKFIVIFLNKESDQYDEIEVTYKTNDKNYELAGIVGKVIYSNNYEKCKKNMIKIVNQFKLIFKNADLSEDESPHAYNSQSIVNKSDFYLKTGGLARVSCTDWSEEMFTKNGWEDNLKVQMIGEEFNIYLSKIYD